MGKKLGGIGMFLFTGSRILFVLVAALFFALILYTVIRGSRHWNLKKKARKVSTDAVVVTKRTDFNSMRANTFDGHVPAVYFVLFRLEEGSEMELAVPASVYSAVNEGDRGALTFRNTQFEGFVKR